MKKFFTLIALAMMSIGVYADNASAVAGEYTVYTEVSFVYITTPYTYTKETVSITDNENGTVTVSYTNDTWGTWGGDSVLVASNADGSYSLSGTGVASMAAHGGVAKDYDITISGTVADSKLTELVFTAEVMGTTTVTLVEGDAPAFEILGEYASDASMTMAYGSMDLSSDTVEVTYVSATQATIEYTDSTWGTFNVVATVEYDSDGNYSISGEDSIYVSSYGKSYYVVLSGTINASLEDWSIVFTLPDVMGGTAVTVVPAAATDDETTGISAVEAATEGGAVYSISGAKVNDSYKGIVIKNGKKVLQK